jgi:hypothetical protein
MLKKVLLGIIAVFALIQLIPSKKNVSDQKDPQLFTLYPTSNTVKNILRTSCYDCHSNNTEYPWYSKIQPVKFWLADHIEEGKEHFNIYEFQNYRPWKQFHKIEECLDEIKEGEMPLESYTYIHKDAVLTDLQKHEFDLWAHGVLDSMKRQYPADSLISPRKRKELQEKKD